MISKDLEAELEKQPFVPLRLHLVSGKTVRISAPNAAWLLQNALMLLRGARPGRVKGEGYDVIALRNIERIEQIGVGR
jgi:hypothetical protein